MSGTKRTSFLNWASSIVSAGVILFIIIVGVFHASSSNLKPFFPFGAEGVLWCGVLFDGTGTYHDGELY